jgi:hypothetical protein
VGYARLEGSQVGEGKGEARNMEELIRKVRNTKILGSENPSFLKAFGKFGLG